MRVTVLDGGGVDGKAKRLSITFAIWAMDAMLGRPLVVLQRLESRIPFVVGSVNPGKNERDLTSKSVAFGEHWRASICRQ